MQKFDSDSVFAFLGVCDVDHAKFLLFSRASVLHQDRLSLLHYRAERNERSMRADGNYVGKFVKGLSKDVRSMDTNGNAQSKPFASSQASPDAEGGGCDTHRHTQNRCREPMKQ